MGILIICSGLDDEYEIAQRVRSLFSDAERVRISGEPDLEQEVFQEKYNGVIIIESPKKGDVLETIQAAKARFPGIPLIMVSNCSDVRSVVAGMRAGLDDYIFLTQIDRLPQSLAECLEQCRLRSQGPTSNTPDPDRYVDQSQLFDSYSHDVRFCRVFENLSAVLFLFNPEMSEVLYISPSYEEIWGRSCQSCYENPRSFLDSVHEDDRGKLLVIIERQSSGEPVDTVYRIKRPDGQTRWIHGWSMPVLDKNGQPYLTIGIAEDISQLAQTEKLLQQYRKVLEDRVAHRTTQFVINETLMLKEIAEHKQTELELRASEERFCGIPRTGLEFTQQHKDGSLIDNSLLTAPIFDAEARINGTMASRRDMMERKKAEAELHIRLELEQRVSAIFAEFLNQPLAQIDDIIHHALAAIGSLVGADRCYVYLIDEEQRLAKKTHEWRAAGVEAVHDSSRNIFFQEMPWFFEQLHHSGAISIPRVSSLPREANANKSLSEKLGFRSAINVPLMYDQTLTGFLTFDTIRTEKCWEADDVAVMRTTGDLIMNALQRKRAEEEISSIKNRAEALALRLVEVQETERRWLARELHDEVGQVITGLNFTLSTLDRDLPENARPTLAKAQEITMQLITVVREMSMNLHPYVLDDGGLLEALIWHIERFTSLTGIQVNFQETDIGYRRFSSNIETAAYRIVQEALTNAARHADVQEVFLKVACDENWLVLQIEDHGKGFDAKAFSQSRQSSGLSGMRERAVLLGGGFQIHSTPGTGTTLRARLPLDWKKDQEDD